MSQSRPAREVKSNRKRTPHTDSAVADSDSDISASASDSWSSSKKRKKQFNRVTLTRAQARLNNGKPFEEFEAKLPAIPSALATKLTVINLFIIIIHANTCLSYQFIVIHM
jgi:hypothetical protein